jgi:hypothetical protein
MGGHINPDLDESGDSHQKFLADLRGELHAALRRGRTYEELSGIMFVGVITIKRFAAGETKKPSTWTVERLVMALDYRIALVPRDMPEIPGELGS